jgi:S1-C subfamily serine protease
LDNHQDDFPWYSGFLYFGACHLSRSREITGLVVSIVTLLAMDVAVAQNTTWKDCELADRDPERSIAACSRVLARGSGPARAGAFHNRGLAYAAKGNLDQAISDISAGIRLDPQRAYRWQERGEIYTRQGKYQQAIADISEAIRIDPTPRTFRFHNRAQAYRGTGDLTRAIADFDEAIRLDPVPRSFRFYDRANALRDAGQYIRALADYESVLRLEPTNAWAFVDRGRTYVRMGRSQAAKSDFDTALKLDQPPNEELRRAVEVELAAISTPSTAAPPPAAVVPIPSPPRTAAPASPQDKDEEISSGSAFVVSRRGHLLTNNHVVSECSRVEIGGVGTAVVLSRDSGNDLALIQAKTQAGLELEPLKVGNKSTRLGEEVIALGYPLRGLLGDGLNVTTGTISALSGIGNDSTKLQFTAPIQPGNSGGALVDRTGAMVGVVASKFSDTTALKHGGFVPQGVNFAIRKEIAIAFLATQGLSVEAMEATAALMTVADIAQQARKSVLPIICRK